MLEPNTDMTDIKPDYKCLQCGWEGSYLDLSYVTVCNGEPGCCTETECPDCGSSWPVPYDDTIQKDSEGPHA